MESAIVTGVSQGIGYELVQKLILSNIQVIGIGRFDNSDHSLAAMNSGNNYSFIKLDLSEPQTKISAQFAQAFNLLKTSKKVFLIHNAGVEWPVGKFSDVSPNEISNSLSINLLNPAVFTSFLLNNCAKHHIAIRIIFISTGLADTPMPGLLTYCVAKTGTEMLIRGVNSERSLYDIPIECIGFRPGPVETRMQLRLRSFNLKDFPSLSIFNGFKENGKLLKPKQVANVIIENLVLGSVESGKIYSVNEFKI